MNLHLKQCRNQHESDHQQQPPSANIPKLHLHHHHHQHPSPLPLLVPHHHCKSSSNNLPPLPHSSSTFPSTLIFRYMLAGAAVPPQLLQSIENTTILHSPSYFLHHPLRHFSHYQPPWYWGRAAMDPEPGRCRRTDGKKWRCSRGVVAGQKYCERHPVEMLKSSGACTNIINNNTLVGAAAGVVDVGCEPTVFSFQGIPDLLRLNYRPRSLQQPDNHAESPMSSATCLSISMPGNSSSDVSLKLSTGNGDQLNWAAGWASYQAASMGGPLAEALRSSISNSQP
ncbi:hypothetical protein E1A91_A04G089400v1 [Gossypium mustelinum]|uniref:Growth-regulating factor n=1 Tax=Gossypium mustelinum TaxID=34275 RepID=A0A5D2ZNW9_GOSMU|nr:hypothetical protein E1A91_A04G089400v1 [Gossypium mustelinum]